MPPKKKGAKKGAKGIILIEFYLLNLGQADEDEYQEVPQVETQPVVQQQTVKEQVQQQPVQQPQVQVQQQPQVQQQTTVQTNSAQRVVQNTGPSDNSQVHVTQRVINLAADQVKSQQGQPLSEIRIDAAEQLSLSQKKELRKQRFQLQDAKITTADALQRVQEEREKKLARAQKFGLVTKEIEDLKRQERAIKFGLNNQSATTTQLSKSEQDAKRQERAIRFGTGAGATATSNDEEEEKRKKRLQRFAEQLNNNDSASVGNRVVKRLKY